MVQIIEGMGKILLALILIISYYAIEVFVPRVFTTWGKKRSFHIMKKYRWHFILFIIIWFQKNFIDAINDPIRDNLGLNFTNAVYAIEGDAVLHLQQFFLNYHLTMALTVIYVMGYMFINYFSIVYFSYMDDQELADKLAINYAVIYLLSIPFYLFLPVDVTSQRIGPMKALAYQLGPNWNQFFMSVDPLDNAVPSLHIAIPFAIILLIYRSQKRRNIHDYDRYMWFCVGLLSVFVFAILYLGIHWIVDIFFGIGVGLLGIYLVEGGSRDFWDWVLKKEWQIRDRIAQRRNKPRPEPPLFRKKWDEPLWKKSRKDQDRYFAKEMGMTLEELRRFDEDRENKGRDGGRAQGGRGDRIRDGEKRMEKRGWRKEDGEKRIGK